MPENIARYHAPRLLGGGADHAWLLAAVEASLAAGTVNVQVDMGDVESVDTFALSALLAAERRLRTARGVLLLADAKPELVEALDAFGVRERFFVRMHEAEGDDSPVVADPDADDAFDPAPAVATGAGAVSGPEDGRVLTRSDLEALDRVVAGAESGETPSVFDVLRARTALDRVRGDRPFW